MAMSKDEFLKKMKTEYDALNYRWNVERSRLEAKTQHHSAEARQRLEKELEELDRLRKKMKEKMIDLEVAGENAWIDFTDDAGEAWEDVRKGTEKAWSAFSEGLKRAVARFK